MTRLTSAFLICAVFSTGTAHALEEADAITKAKEALRTHAGDLDVSVARVSKAQWRNSSLGCPQPGRMYAQVIVSGYQVILSAGGKEYDYRVSDYAAVLCEKSGAKTKRVPSGGEQEKLHRE